MVSSHEQMSSVTALRTFMFMLCGILGSTPKLNQQATQKLHADGRQKVLPTLKPCLCNM